MLPARASRTGPRPTFTVDDAVDAAMALGLDRFSLAGVAKALGVSTPALYRVTESREHLAHLCLERVARELAASSSLVEPPGGWDGTGWQRLLRDYVADMWRALELHEGLASAILAHPGAHAHVNEYLVDLRDALAASGFPGDGDAVAFVLDFIGDTVLVTHIGIAPMRRRGDSGERGIDTARRMLESRTGAEGDAIIGVDESWADRGWLDRKVDFIIAGLEAGILPAAH
ncbi:TetR/AcrR family transcriptional regulator [Gulosibacter faecalis]|jgi:AcrR family transcriptional regulator|uniref:TetR/AcrR family transcriptional regulator n=1 Tax=Gulosibacter faecalis TaxID=272240 RepID=A0ABW5UX67_9MICO|nr:TetR/AcrR family transcriptional regulator [Gulosibacter faecalis]